MIELPKSAKNIKLEDASVEFYEFLQDDITYFYFDTSLCSAPEPMVNALLGLQLLQNEKQKLIMINHKAPGGLFPKITDDFIYNILDINTGVQVIFALKHKKSIQTDFNNNSCAG